jgi:transcriptional regulator with XRE-family HTH domain
MTFLESVAPALRLLRKRAGLTQRGLAEISGVSKNLLSNWETGATQPSMESLAKVLEALDVDLLDFHNTIRLLTGKAVEKAGPSTVLPPALRDEHTDHLVLLLDRAPKIALWCLQLLNTLRNPAVAAALERSILGGEDGEGTDG